MKNHTAWAQFILLLALASCMLLILTGCKPLGKADPFDYIDLQFSGYDGNGNADVRFDCETMVVDLLGKAPESYEEFSQWLLAYSQYDDGIRISYTPDSGLSNGDKVSVTVTTSGIAEKKVKSGTKTFPVSGLPEVKTVDVFQDIEVSFEGIVGDITRTVVTRLSDDPFLRACSFRVEPEGDLHNGDTVTITITNSDALARDFLCLPKETVKTVTVSGLPEYLTDSDLLLEDAIRGMIPRYLSECAREDDFWFSYSEPRYYKTYFCTAKEGCFAENHNRLEVFICYDEYMRGEYRWTRYEPLSFRDIILEPDGSLYLDYEDAVSAVFYTDPDSIVEQLEKSYEVEEVFIEY